MTWFRSFHCRLGAPPEDHERCVDGAARSCVCEHHGNGSRVQLPTQPKKDWEQLREDEAILDQRIIAQRKSAGLPLYQAWEDPEVPDAFFIRIRYSDNEVSDLPFRSRAARDESLDLLVAEEISS